MRKSVRKTKKTCKQERAGKENNYKSIKGQQEGESEAMNVVVVVVVKGQCEGESDSKAMNIVGGGDDLMIKVQYLIEQQRAISTMERRWSLHTVMLNCSPETR